MWELPHIDLPITIFWNNQSIARNINILKNFLKKIKSSSVFNQLVTFYIILDVFNELRNPMQDIFLREWQQSLQSTELTSVFLDWNISAQDCTIGLLEY